MLKILILSMLVLFSFVGCDENDPNFPEVHGTVSVSPSPLPPFEIQFKDEVSPTPVTP